MHLSTPMELNPRIRRHNNGYFNAKLNHQDGHVFKDDYSPRRMLSLI